MAVIKSPLRYPGGKSKFIPQIMSHMPVNVQDFREPFVGGGSVFIHVRQAFPDAKVWINDLNFDLYCFWKESQKDSCAVAERVEEIKNTVTNGSHLFTQMKEVPDNKTSDFDRAVRFFVMNRITFSGTVDCGGYSEQAFLKRFTHSSIARLAALKHVLEGVKITNEHYKSVVESSGDNVIIFLDPPYIEATKSKLYGKKGDLHSGFDHSEFAQDMASCLHQWLITYDNSPIIRSNFHFANIYEWEAQYGMNNYKQGKADKGKELFLCNYSIPKTPMIDESITNQLALTFE